MKIKDITEMDPEKIETQYYNVGFQASNLARGIEIIREMKKQKATIFLTFTSNMVASGLRGIFTELCKRKFVDCIITAGGSIDHDLIRCKIPYEMGDFVMDDTKLHKSGTNRIGNILVPNKAYEYLEEFIQPVFEELYQEGKITSPSKLIRKIGEKTDESSFLHWCTKNKIPVFCPGITDSAIGLQTYFFKQKRKDFGVDVTKDMNELAGFSLNAEKTGGIILGGGISKHHAIGVNLLRGGFDHAVYITTASPWDGSLSGARTNEGISWGKIKERANHITVDSDATIAFPLIMSSFLKQ
ncbi:deoxyhypusine synthase [Candidatus Micrarchaeota archaeon]|nr:deoxyhypusine synthase [Candidatus Micrarchaeota archaeon]